MKKIIIFTGILLFTALSCRKEVQPITPNRSSASIMRTTCYDGITRDCNGEILTFTDEAQFMEVYECLERQYEMWNDAFEQQYATLNDDDFNALADSLGFDEDSTLIAFEQRFPGFVSQRSKLRMQEAAWLNNTVLNPATNPFNNDYLNDIIMQTIFNQYQEVRIGNTIVHISELDGTVFTLPAGYCDVLSNLRSDPSSGLNNPIVNVQSSDSLSNECRVGIKEQDEEMLTNNHKFFWKLTFWKYSIIGTSIKGNVKYYKQRNNGTWKKTRRYLAVDVYGTWWNNGCDDSASYAKRQMTLKRRSQRDVNLFEGARRLKTKNGYAKGSIYLDNRSNYYDDNIDW